MVLARIQEKPFASLGKASPHIRQLIRRQQFGRGSRNRPQHALQFVGVVIFPFEAALHWSQSHVPRSALNVIVQSSQRCRRHRTLIDQRPKNIMNCFAQLFSPTQHFLRAIGVGLPPLEQPIHLPGIQGLGIFPKSDEINIRFQEFLRLRIAVVERVHEIKTHVARNQVKPRRTPPFDFLCLPDRIQSFFLSTYYLTIKSILTS
jgi:hypothetical protein